MKKIVLLPFLILFLISCNTGKNIEETQVDTLIKSTQSWNDSILVEYPEGQPEITILKIDIPPHTRLDMHKHPVINAGVLTKGELTVVLENGQTLTLKAGDAIIEVVETYHYGINEGDETAQIIVFYAGIKDVPITEYKETH